MPKARIEGDQVGIVLSPKEQVSKFVTRIWEHPLLTTATRAHRFSGERRLDRYMKTSGINKDDFFAMPIGSSVWITTRDSDHDILLVFKNAESVGSFSAPPDPEKKIEILDVSSAQRVKQGGAGSGPNLLLTPDEYIIGNTRLAQETRLGFIETAMSDPKNWNMEMDVVFNFFYRGWWKKSGKSRERFQDALESRSKALEIEDDQQELWREKFIEAWENFKFPRLKTFSQALHTTNGALSLTDRYMAKGL